METSDEDEPIAGTSGSNSESEYLKFSYTKNG